MYDESPFHCVAHGNTDARHPLDYEEARRALALFADPAPGAGLHLQAKPHWRTRVVPGGDLDAAAAAVRELDAGDSVYFGLNPCPPSTPSGPDVKASEILCRRWLALDIDRAKGDGDKKLSATAAEKGLAREVAGEIAAGLALDGWPDPVVLDSGNGYDLCYRVDLPNDRLSQALLRDVLRGLAKRFDRDGVTVDKSMHNADRVIKLPGSWACKGPDTPERPHRRAGLLGEPEKVEVVSVELLKAAAGVAKGVPRENAPFPAIATGAGTTAYARTALERECGKMTCTKAGGLNDQLNRSGFALGQLVGAGLLTEMEVYDALLRAARAAGADSPVKDEDTLRRGIAAGRAEPRQAPGFDIPVSAADRVPAGETITYRASSVTPRKVSYLWPGRLPLGKLVTFAGPGGIGKTFVLCDVTARVTSGLEWPFAGGECASPGSVLFLSGEDDPEDTLVPRLIECKADLDRVAFLKTAALDFFTLADLKTLDRALSENPGVKLVVLDPPTSFLGDVDDHKNAELRRLLSPLSGWAIRNRLCVVLNTHFNKGSGGNVEAALRVLGSVAWTNAVRVAHAFARDPEDDARALFAPMKVNITRKHKALAYRVLPVDDDRARLEWLAEVDTTADQAVNQDAAPRRRRVVASEWLAGLFTGGVSELPSKTVWDRKKAETTLSDDALKEAKEMMGIRAAKRTGPDGEVAWWWAWPADARDHWEASRRHTTNGEPPP